MPRIHSPSVPPCNSPTFVGHGSLNLCITPGTHQQTSSESKQTQSSGNENQPLPAILPILITQISIAPFNGLPTLIILCQIIASLQLPCSKEDEVTQSRRSSKHVNPAEQADPGALHGLHPALNSPSCLALHRLHAKPAAPTEPAQRPRARRGSPYLAAQPSAMGDGRSGLGVSEHDGRS